MTPRPRDANTLMNILHGMSQRKRLQQMQQRQLQEQGQEFNQQSSMQQMPQQSQGQQQVPQKLEPIAVSIFDIQFLLQQGHLPSGYLKAGVEDHWVKFSIALFQEFVEEARSKGITRESLKKDNLLDDDSRINFGALSILAEKFNSTGRNI